jgi:DHA2 family multidrug resistance protein-like MFS transporter
MFVDERQQRLAITTWSTAMFGGAAIGPVFGGVLLDHFWWGSVFLAGAPMMGLLVVAAPLTLPETPPSGSARLDVPSVALCLVGVLSIAWGVKQFAGTSAAPGVVAVTLVGGLACAALFVRRQRRLAEPMLRLELLRDRRVTAVLIAMVTAGACLAALGWVTTQYLQLVAGMSPLRAAVAFAPMGLTMAAGCLLSPLATRWLAPGSVVAAGLAISAVGVLPAVFGSGAVTLVVADSLVAFGTGPLFALGTGVVVSSVAPQRVGSAAALAEVSNFLGGTLGITVFGTLAAAVYRSELGHAAPAARESIARATDLAAATGGPDGNSLLRNAHAAFGTGITVIATVEVVLFAALGWLCRRDIRN